MLRVHKAWLRPCPSAVQVPCALNLAFPLRPLGFNGGGEDSDSLDTPGEYALAQPGKPRFGRHFENGTVLVDNGAAEAFSLQPETAEGPGTDVLGAGPSGSGWPGHSRLAAMLPWSVPCAAFGLPVEGILTDSVSDAQLASQVQF